MVSFGPWRQDPDVLQWQQFTAASGNDPFTGVPIFDYDGATVSRSTPYQDPAYPITVDDLRDAVVEAHDSLDDPTPGASDFTLYGARHAWGYNLSHPQWSSGWTGAVSRRRFEITLRPYGYDPLDYGYSDPNAIGVDYITQPYSPDDPWASVRAPIMSRAIAPESTLAGWWHDTSAAPTYVPGASTLLRLLPKGGTEGGGAEVTLASVDAHTASTYYDGNPAQRVLGESLDLTPYLQSTDWSGSLWTVPEPLFVAPQGTPTAIGSEGDVRYGWGIETLRINTTVRPPLYRFVYDETPAVPYRRTFPRDDSLAGGAGRNFPRPRSVQSSNRIGGGYL